MHEILERKQSFSRTLFAIALSPAIFGSPLFLAVILSYAFTDQVQIPDWIMNVGFLGLILFYCGFLFMLISSIYALITYFQKPSLNFARPFPKDIFWSLIAVLACFLVVAGVALQNYLWHYFALFNGIDLLSSTLIFVPIGLYFVALVKAYKFKKPKNKPLD